MAWPLTQLTSVLSLGGTSGSIVGFHVHADEAKFYLGVDGGWGDDFAAFVKHATAVAILAG